VCCVRMVSVELLGACHLDLCFPGSFSTFHVKRKFGSLFRSWENLSTLTSGKSERINHLACFSLLTKTSHVWGR